MIKQIGIAGVSILASLVVLAGCDSFDTSHQEFASDYQASRPDGSTQEALSKAAFTTTVYDFDGNAYVLTYNYDASGPNADSSATTFTYGLSIGSLSGFHFALEIPTCASELLSTDPAGGYNNNANGTIEFGPEDFDSNTASVSLVFDGYVPLGVVYASFKFSGSGDTPEQAPIAGPCQDGGYWITGKVFLDDPAGGTSGYQDSNEPGIGGVEVSLFEGDGSPNEGEPTQFTAADGSFAFHVLGPPVFDANYRVEILDTGSGLNTQLLDPSGYWDATTTLVRYVVLNTSANTVTVDPFGFSLNIKKAVDAFEGTSSVTDMLPPEFWKVQVTERGSKKYKPVVDAATMDAYLAAIRGFNDDLIPVVFSEGIDRLTAADILRSPSRNDPQEELKTLTLAALFNFAAGRGACATSELTSPPAGAAIQFDVCAVPDPGTTRLIIEQALVEWLRIGGITVGKESGGDMSRVLNAMM